MGNPVHTENDDVTRATARHDLVVGLFMAALAAFLYYATLDIPPGYDDEAVGPRFVPQAICILLGAIGAIIALQGLRGMPAPNAPTRFSSARFWVDVAPLSFISFVYVGMFALFGYWLSTAVLIFAGCILFGVRSRALVFLPLIAASLFYYIFFKLMRVFEPPAKLFNILDLLPLG